jgi:hypothetical protein
MWGWLCVRATLNFGKIWYVFELAEVPFDRIADVIIWTAGDEEKSIHFIVGFAMAGKWCKKEFSEEGQDVSNHYVARAGTFRLYRSYQAFRAIEQ